MNTITFAPNRATRVPLGRTGIEVCRIGVGGGSGISNEDLEYAIERGVNYVFHSTDLHAWAYSRSSDAIRRYARRGASEREKVVLATVSYACDPEKLLGILVDQIVALGVDHIDVFHWGWVTRQIKVEGLIERTEPVMRAEAARRAFDSQMDVHRQVADELRCRGYARYLGISTHDRALASAFAMNPLVDVVMFRYNIAHRGAERQIFPTLGSDRPGTVAFNTTHAPNGSLVRPPAGLPESKYRPTFEDLYRFVLDRPEVDVVLTGPSVRDHVDESLRALERPPLDERLRRYLETIGDVHAGKAVIAGASSP